VRFSLKPYYQGARKSTLQRAFAFTNIMYVFLIFVKPKLPGHFFPVF